MAVRLEGAGAARGADAVGDGAGEGAVGVVPLAGALVRVPVQALPARGLAARKVSGRPKRRKLAHAFLWEYSYKRLKLAQLPGRHGVPRTCGTRWSGSTQIMPQRETVAGEACLRSSTWGPAALPLQEQMHRIC